MTTQDMPVTIIRTAEGDRLDLLCWKRYGSLTGRVVEQALAVNPSAALYDELPAGVLISLPELPSEPLERSLW